MDLILACTSFHPAPGIASWGTHAGDAAHAALGLAKGLRALGHRTTLVAPLDVELVQREGLSLARRLTPLAFEASGVHHERTIHDLRLPSGVEIVLLGGDPPGPADAEETARRHALFAHAVTALARHRLGSVRPAGGGAPAEPELEAVVAIGEGAALIPFAIREGAKASARDGGPSPRLLAGLARIAMPLDVGADVRLPPTSLAQIGVAPDMFSTDGVEFYGQISYTKAAAIAADRVVVLGEQLRGALVAAGSPHKLDGVYRARGAELVSIGSGVDQAQYNSATDPHLVTRFDGEDLTGKVRGKALLLQELELDPSVDAPLLAVVGAAGRTPDRTALASAIARALRSDLRVVVALARPDAELSASLDRLARAHVGRLTVRVGAPEPLLHRVVAAADLLLPLDDLSGTGISVRAAMRYGALPVAPRTPAFAEAIVDAEAGLTTGTGFLFDTTEDPFGAIQRGISAFATGAPWRKAQRRAMRLEGGWDRAARRLERLIQQIEA